MPRARRSPPASAAPPSQDDPTADLDQLPGHNIRRLQQIAVAIFLQETAGSGLTPVQFAALRVVTHRPGLDQRTLARAIGLDTSTTAGVIDRLQARGLLQRTASPDDRRVRLLTATPDGAQALADVVPAMLRAQQRILAPLPADDQQVFLRLLAQLVAANNTLSRAPSDAAAGPE